MLKIVNLSQLIRHRVFKSTFIYTLTTTIRSAIPFLMLPILTRYLSPYDYGVVATFQKLLNILIVFVGIRMHGAIAVNYFRLGQEKIKEYIGNVLLIISISFLLIFALIFFFKYPLSNLLKFPANWLTIMVAVALSRAILMLNLTIWQIEQKALAYGIFQILQTLANISLSIFLVVALCWKWQGRLLGIIIPTIIFALISVYYRRRLIRFSINKEYIKDALKFGIPLIPGALGRSILTGIDRIFINSMVGVAATGIYSVGYQIGMIVYLIAASFNMAWWPFLYKKLKENNYETKVKIVQFTYLYFIAIIAFAIVLSLISPLIIKILVGNDFQDAYIYVFWIAISYAATGMFLMVVNYISYVKKTYILSWITLTSACINILLNYLLIKRNGAIGAAQATAIASIISFISTWILCSKVFEMPWMKVFKDILYKIKISD